METRTVVTDRVTRDELEVRLGHRPNVPSTQTRFVADALPTIRDFPKTMTPLSSVWIITELIVASSNKMSAGTLEQHLFCRTRRTNRRSVLRRRDVSVSSHALDARLRVVSERPCFDCDKYRRLFL